MKNSNLFLLVAVMIFPFFMGCENSEEPLVSEELLNERFAPSNSKIKGVNDPGWHGICILNGELAEYIVDEKPKNGKAVPIFIFTSEGFFDGPGTPNPLGFLTLEDGTTVDYLPFRLQNNVFRGKGVLWSMWKVEGTGLYADVEEADGSITTIYSTSNPDHIRTRNLFADPFLSEDEILAYVSQNGVPLIVEALGVSFNCPIVPADGDPVINLNPNYIPL